jgi:type VI secretion system protein ImpJ
MAEYSVHWHEGMFLSPHHMQVAESLDLRQAALRHKWDLHYNWGLRALDLDVAALADYRFAVNSLQARLRDGTLVAVPEDGVLPPLDLKPALEVAGEVTVFLAVPQVQPGKRNAPDPEEEPFGEEPAPGPAEAAPGPNGEGAADTRYLLDRLEVEDENSGDNAQPILVRMLNLKVLPSTEPRAGYEVLELARVRRGAGPDAVPELDGAYIPPLLACDAWPPLQAGILQSVCNIVGRRLEESATRIVAHGVSFDTRHPGAAARLGQLHVFNAAYAVLGVLAFADGVHPLKAYLELCRLVGQLAVFGPARQVPALPRYDHDDLGGCFFRVRQYLDDLLEEMAEPPYEERPFVGEDKRMQVALEPKWLEPAWRMYVGVHSPLKAEECVRLLTQRGQLDMKIGSSTHVDEIFLRGLKGLEFTHVSIPPDALPSDPGLIYFQVSRQAQREEWQNVQRSLTLAIRLNQRFIAGNIQGEQRLAIQTGTRTVPMQFTLYLVPQET